MPRFKGVTPGSTLEKDLAGMTDAAKAKKRRKEQEDRTKAGLDKVFKDRKPRSATAGMSASQRARYYDTQASENLRMALVVEKSGTGNTAAAATHRRVARDYAAKAAALRKKKEGE